MQSAKKTKKDIIECLDIKDVGRCLAAWRVNAEPVDIIINAITYWQPIQRVVLIDIPSGESFLCSSDGTVLWKRKNGKETAYKNCHSGVIDDKKTASLLRKKGFLIFYDFVQKKSIKLTKEGEIWKKAEHDRRWEKVSAP